MLNINSKILYEKDIGGYTKHPPLPPLLKVDVMNLKFNYEKPVILTLEKSMVLKIFKNIKLPMTLICCI